ncbi:hypothetical protein AAL_00672 [Moelleriella libera RCEF 2490]|uniref:Uncharacterized protein n=1 Tax=Moelleriella libera RCEF 2490 TaxID=1081109 RepID=A0A166V2K3_9HYPO|nr:hypothetical protein AAL_00672 [Moelleriella libera RCEF 2490]
MDVSSSGIPPDVVDWGCSRARRPICWNRDTVDAIGELRNRLAEDIAVRKSAHAVIGLLAQILGDVIRPPCTNCHYGRGDWPDMLSELSDVGSAAMDTDSTDSESRSGQPATDDEEKQRHPGDARKSQGEPSTEEGMAIALDESDIALVEVAGLMAQPLMTLSELESEIDGWY